MTQQIGTAAVKLRTHRHRDQMIAAILNALPDKKTRILYRAAMSNGELKHYLSELIRLEMIQFDEVTRMYSLLERGQRFLSIYNRLNLVTKLWALDYPYAVYIEQ